MKPAPMEAALQASSLHVLLILMSKALTRSGFGDVQILDRRETKQKSRFGGHEMLCETWIGSEPARVVVKVISAVARARHLDELAGVVDRMDAALGLLITPHHLTKKARANEPKYRRSRITSIDGPALAALCFKHKIAVRGETEVDYAYLTALEEQSDKLLTFLAGHDL